jgi:hypothetical protein
MKTSSANRKFSVFCLFEKKQPLDYTRLGRQKEKKAKINTLVKIYKTITYKENLHGGGEILYIRRVFVCVQKDISGALSPALAVL